MQINQYLERGLARGISYSQYAQFWVQVQINQYFVRCTNYIQYAQYWVQMQINQYFVRGTSYSWQKEEIQRL